MNVWRKQYPNAPLQEPAGEWFVNRKRYLDLLWKWACRIPTKGSYSITGLRRTGKSSIMAKLYNRLYFEQNKVMPIYISFVDYLHRKEPITAQQFAEEYVRGAVRSYLSFTYRRPEWQDKNLSYRHLKHLAEELSDKVTLKWFWEHQLSFEKSYIPSHSVVQWCINFLAGHARWEGHPMLVMIDEFQVLTEVYYPEDNRVMDITNSFQPASESWDAPLLVSGSSVSILREQALGGLLSGRFRRIHVGPLAPEHALQMVFQLSHITGIPMTEALAEMIVSTTQGYPFSIESIMFSASPAIQSFPEINAVEQVIDFELTDHGGALREHYDEEYGKYVTQLNGDNLTRKILYWLTNQKVDEFDITARIIANAMQLDVVEVQKSLDILHRMDIIQRRIAMVYSGPRDPLLRLYLNSFHGLTIDELSDGLLANEDTVRTLRRKLNEMQGEINRKIGHFTEIIVAGLVRAFDRRLVDGKLYFGIGGDIKLPHCDNIHRRIGVVKNGIPHEIDVIGEYFLAGLPNDIDRSGNAGTGAWMISVRYRGKRMGVADVRTFIDDVNVVQEEKRYGEVVRWYFSKTGFTEDATALLRSEGIYHSDLKQFNLLAEMFDLMSLQM